MDRFPLPANVSYSYSAGFRPPAHMGVDIFAPLHSPLVAVESGQAWSANDPKGGRVVYLLGARSGARYYYAHLESWALGIITATLAKPLQVEAGERIGDLGTSGNAQGTSPHCHFQLRRGGDVVDPFPELYAADPHHRGEIPEPTVLDRFGGEVTDAARSIGNGLGMLALLWVLVNASKGR